MTGKVAGLGSPKGNTPLTLMSAAPLPSGKHFDVIIVGAGVTGLQCATSLREDHGIANVLVLEAAEYIGG